MRAWWRWIPPMGVGIGIALTLLALPAIAGTCRLADPVAPSSTTRNFQSDRLGVTLTLPNNYRALLRRTGHITFHDPSSFEFLQCLARTGEYGSVPPHASLEIYPGLNGNTDLVQLVRIKRPWVDFYSPDYVPVIFAARPAIRYDYPHAIYGGVMVNLSFLSRDGKMLLTLSGLQSDPVMQHALTQVTGRSPFAEGTLPTQPLPR